MCRIFNKTIKQHDGITHWTQKEFSQIEPKKHKENKCHKSVPNNRFPDLIPPHTVILDLKYKVFRTKKINIKTFDKIYGVIFHINIFIKAYLFGINQRKDLLKFYIIDRRFKTFIPWIGFSFIKIVMQYFESFSLNVSILCEYSTLLGKKKFFLCLVKKQCGQYDQDRDHCCIQC